MNKKLLAASVLGLAVLALYPVLIPNPTISICSKRS
jgi:hypothetical protein